MNFAIENVPAPNRAGNTPLTLDGFPFGDLEVGQSFFVPNHSPSNRARAVPFALAKETYQDRRFRRYADVRTVEIDGIETTQNGFRYARIK